VLFRAASVTKMFTAAAVVSLAEAGRIDLHAPIGRYIRGLSPGISRITPHQLLNHTGGLVQRRPMIPDRADARGGRLFARIAPLEAPLFHIGADRFSLGPPLAGSLANVLTYMRGSEGRPEYLYRSNMVAYRKPSSLEQPRGSNR
jgi:CubicO group peptidase (beta-lactamase class C family)